MKTLIFGLSVLISTAAFAQNTSVTDIPASQDTTISIKKGTAVDRDFDVLTGKADITGDPNVLQNAARESWKKACADWRTEIKDLNKNNTVLALNCNAPKCTKDDKSYTCVSQGEYQLQVKIRK